MRYFVPALACLLFASSAWAHGETAHPEAEATYIANEGVVVRQGEQAIMFDPLFTEGFGTYQTVPDEERAKMFAGTAPYHGITAIFISHAHSDHFAPVDAITYLRLHPEVTMYGPVQMHEMMQPLAGFEQVASRVVQVSPQYDGGSHSVSNRAVYAEAIRIPHAGGERRRDIQNLVWRVSFKSGAGGGEAVVMHMGDADPADTFFAPHDAHFKAKRTHTAFPPYWFFGSPEGQAILSTRINASESVGVHVPSTAPPALEASGFGFFHTPGETRTIAHPK